MMKIVRILSFILACISICFSIAGCAGETTPDRCIEPENIQSNGNDPLSPSDPYRQNNAQKGNVSEDRSRGGVLPPASPFFPGLT